MCPASLESRENPFPGFGLFMDRELYREAIRQAEEMKVPSIRFGLSGEPLLVADIDRWVAEAVKKGFIDLALITNGQLLDRRMSQKLIEAGLTKLMISVDAATEGTYSQVRPGGNFDRLIGNIQSFLRIRKELKTILPVLRLSFVVMTKNQRESDLFREKFSNLADYLSFQDYLNINGSDKTNFKVGPVKKRPAKNCFFCPDPLTRLAVYADGGLFPCCSDFGRLKPLGHLKTHSLKEIWNSAQALALVGPNGQQNPACQRCLAASGLSLWRDLADSQEEDDQPSAFDKSQTAPINILRAELALSS
jgi:radical SAM protein with 4Fe4S-binding SPASM domain